MLKPVDNIVSRDFCPLPIETDAALLERQARAAQAAWFKAPQDRDMKVAYASALRQWARETKNDRALAHAEQLLQEPQP